MDWSRLRGMRLRGRVFYGATFEFGTLGDSLFNKIRSMQTMYASKPAATLWRCEFSR
jgi:hypothetical protein